MLRYLPSHNFFKMHERPVLNQLRLRPEKNRSRLQKTGLVQSGPVFCLSGRMMDRSQSRSFLKRQKDRDRTGLSITKDDGIQKTKGTDLLKMYYIVFVYDIS